MDQVISSERALQVHLAARLLDLFWEAGVNRRVFVEPAMRLKSGQRVHPDLLICNTRAIIGVVELKYQPKQVPKYAKDFATFEALAAHGTNIEIDSKRYRGPDPGRGRYALDTSPLYVWAGVYRGPIRTVPDQWPSFCARNQLMVLHAATQEDDEPEVVDANEARTKVL